MARATRWNLRERDNRGNARRRLNSDVMAARSGPPAEQQAVGSRLTGPQGVGAPSVTGEDVPARGPVADALAGRPLEERGERGRERVVAEPKELDNTE